MRQHVERESHEKKLGRHERLLGHASASQALPDGMSCETRIGSDYCLQVVRQGRLRCVCALIGASAVGLALRGVAGKHCRVLAQPQRPGGRLEVPLDDVSPLERDVDLATRALAMLVEREY